MHDLVCLGLEGTNPLGMLASLGLFRLLAIRDPQVRMGWVQDQGWHPVFRANSPLDPEQIAGWLTDTVRDLGSVKAGDSAARQRGAREAKAKIEPLKKALKNTAAQARDDAKKRGLKGPEAVAYLVAATSASEGKLREAEAEYQAARVFLADALGQGIAHLGDVIGVQPEIFRAKAIAGLAVSETKDTALLLDCLASQASDACLERDRLVPSPFSFGNGGAGQFLLKDFRALAISVNQEEMANLITSRVPLGRKAISLNWDPRDQRSYALQWNKPTADEHVNVGANALAFIGLACLPAMPTRTRLGAVGFGESNEAWTWPLWSALIPLDVVRSVLADPTLQESDPHAGQLAAKGITAICRSKRITLPPPVLRNFFLPTESRILMCQ